MVCRNALAKIRYCTNVHAKRPCFGARAENSSFLIAHDWNSFAPESLQCLAHDLQTNLKIRPHAQACRRVRHERRRIGCPVEINLVKYLRRIVQVPSQAGDCGVIVRHLIVDDAICVPDELLTQLASCRIHKIAWHRTSEHDAFSDAAVPPIDNGSMFSCL